MFLGFPVPFSWADSGLLEWRAQALFDALGYARLPSGDAVCAWGRVPKPLLSRYHVVLALGLSNIIV